LGFKGLNWAVDTWAKVKKTGTSKKTRRIDTPLLLLDVREGAFVTKASWLR